MSLGMLAMMRQEHMKTASVSLGVLAGVWQERVKRASVTIRMLQQPRRSGLRVLQQGVRAPAAEQLASAGAAATAFWRLICGAAESLKSRSLTLVPSSWLTWAGKPKQTDAEGAAQKLMQLAISDTGGLVNLGIALTSRFQILARFRHQNLEPRKRLHDYFPNLNTKPGPQF